MVRIESSSCCGNDFKFKYYNKDNGYLYVDITINNRYTYTKKYYEDCEDTEHLTTPNNLINEIMSMYKHYTNIGYKRDEPTANTIKYSGIKALNIIGILTALN